MRRFARRISLLAVLFASAVTLLAQADNVFDGKWELNVAKSKFSPGPAPKSETVTVANGTTTVEGTGETGQPFKWSFTPAPGKAVPIDGQEGATVLAKTSGNTIDHTWTGPAGNTHGHGVVSKDGKTMTYTQTGKDPKGQAVHNVFIFEKQ
jgi:hypothetical protein